jgi:PPOX class probable F420-dependent enzyme
MVDVDRERYVSLATFRKDGREVKTPVWIAAGDGRVFVYTNVTSGKVKRIRNNGRARVAPSDARGRVKGDWMDAKARLIEDPEGRERGIRTLVEKYGWQMRLALFLSRLSGRYRQRAIIELEL